MNNPRRPQHSTAGTVLALFALLLIGAGLVGLTAMVMPAAFGLVFVIFGFFAFGALQYLVWGWWLKPPRSNDDE